MPEGTVRCVIKHLKDQNKVFFIPKGKIHLYAATKRASDDFNRLIKIHALQSNNKELYQIHGLTLKLTSQALGKPLIDNATPVGGSGVVRGGWGVGGSGVGETSFQLSFETLMVYGSFSNASLDFDGFMVWLARVDGFLISKGWPRIEGNMQFWVVSQYGLNKDYAVFRNDSPTNAVSLKGFEKWFARVYDKKMPDGSHVLRDEVHSREEQSLTNFLMQAGGNMTNAQVMTMVQTVASALNNNTNQIVDVVKVLAKLVKRVDELDRDYKNRN